jgi:hypothetical protein
MEKIQKCLSQEEKAKNSAQSEMKTLLKEKK